MSTRIRRTIPPLIAAVTVASLFLAMTPGRVTADDDTVTVEAHKKEVADWDQSRLESLKSPQGYLSLAGLFSLTEGSHRLGSADDNDLVFPAGAPAHVGVLILKNGDLTFEVADGVNVTHDGEAVGTLTLETDAGRHPTVLWTGSFQFYVIDRAGDLYVRLKDTESDLLRHFDGVERFPVDIAWRIEGRFEPYDPPITIMVPNVLGGEFPEQCPGRVVFEVGGQTCSLEPTSASRGRLFYVFGDGTSGEETYGGGRFMVSEGPSEDGTVVIDFNKAYNPPCAFTPFATCPLPHTANRLEVRIESGEKKWGEGH